jgi:chemotaxis protein CheZ
MSFFPARGKLMPSSPSVKTPYSIERWRDAQRQSGTDASEAPPILTGDDLGGRLDVIQTRVESILSRLDGLPPADGLPRDDDFDGGMPDLDAQKDVRVEIARMVLEIGRAKRAIAEIRHPMRDQDHVDNASRHLEEIVATTEAATNEIIHGVDAIDEILKQLRARVIEDTDAVEHIDDISQHLIKMIEACGFQDITGQRVTQVVKVLRFIENRIAAMIEIWGLDAFQGLPLDEAELEDPDARLLNGPQLDGQGLSQDDVDALFD